MKRKIYALSVFLLTFGLLLSCSDEEINVANTLSVAAFYPTIVMDHTEVIITGTALDQVTEVIFPGEKVGGELVILDNTRLKVLAPSGVSTEAGALVLKTNNAEIKSRQTIRAAVPRLSYLNPADIVKTYSDLFIVGNDLLLAEAIQFSDDENMVEVKAINFVRKSNSQIIVNVPADTPLGNNINIRILFKNGEIMSLGNLEVEKGQGSGGHWEPKDIIVYDDGPVKIKSWDPWLTVTADKFADVKVNDILRIYITDVGSDSQGGLRDGNWKDLAEGTNYFSFTDENITNGYYDWLVDEEILSKLNSGGLIIGGKNHTITKVVYVTEVWVEGGGEESLTDPITEATIMLNDFEPHDGHDAGWDLSWQDSEATAVTTDEVTSNTYIRLVKDINGWIHNCNHVDHGTIHGIENYVVKLDILVEDGVTVPSKQDAQWVLADTWCWFGDGLIPETTNGKWITVRANCSDLELSGDIEFGSNTNGLYGNFPAGVCFDNLRLDPKE